MLSPQHKIKKCRCSKNVTDSWEKRDFGHTDRYMKYKHNKYAHHISYHLSFKIGYDGVITRINMFLLTSRNTRNNFLSKKRQEGD